MQNRFRVIKDTRESNDKTSWIFTPTIRCEGTGFKTLAEGDYTLEGLEDYFVIERKGSVTEFAHNLFEPRFYREMERLQKYPYSFILLEFDMDQVVQYPKGSGIPSDKIKDVKMTGFLYLRKLNELIVNYNTKVIFCGKKNGLSVALSIMKRMWESYEPPETNVQE